MNLAIVDFKWSIGNEMLSKSIFAHLKKKGHDVLLICARESKSVNCIKLTRSDRLVSVFLDSLNPAIIFKFLKSIKNIGTKYNKKLKLSGILVTMFDKRLKKSREILEELRYSFKDILLETVIPRNSKLAEAPAEGKPVALVDLTSKGSLAYLQLAQELSTRK